MYMENLIILLYYKKIINDGLYNFQRQFIKMFNLSYIWAIISHELYNYR